MALLKREVVADEISRLRRIVDAHLRRLGHGDRLDDVLDEVERVRVEAGSPPLAAPIGQVVASQAVVNVLGATRYAFIVNELRDLVSGRFGLGVYANLRGHLEALLQRSYDLAHRPDGLRVPLAGTLRILAHSEGVTT